MLGKEKRDDDEKKKDKRLVKKGKRGKAKGSKADTSSIASRTAMSTSTLHAFSIQESSEEEEEEEEDDGELNGSGDFPTYSKKKGDLKSISMGQLRYVSQFYADFFGFKHV